MNGVAAIRRRLSTPESKQNSLLLPALVLIAAVFLYPVIAMLVRSFTTPPGGLSHYKDVFTTGGVLTILGRSLLISVIVTVVSLLVGYPFAYVAATTRHRRLGLLMVGFAAASLFISVIVRSYAWLAILQKNGVLDTWLGHIGIHVNLVNTMAGVVIGMVQYAIPFMVLSLYDNMRRIDIRLTRAAAALGASPMRAFARVYLPLTLPGLVAGCVIVFITTLGYYIIPSILGGPHNSMIGQLIATEIQVTLNWGRGSAEGALVLFVAVVAFVAFYRASLRSRGARGNA